MKQLICAVMVMAIASSASAQEAKGPVTLSNDKPVEITSDTLEVMQDQHQAIFIGNVIAIQGDITMRANKMIVHYRDTETGGDKGISQIDSEGNVIFTNPTDTAKGDFAVYDVDKESLDLTGTVILTRDKNILKGTRMTYDLKTNRSVLTAGGAPVTGGTGSGRVQGVFMPNAGKETK